MYRQVPLQYTFLIHSLGPLNLAVTYIKKAAVLFLMLFNFFSQFSNETFNDSSFIFLLTYIDKSNGNCVCNHNGKYTPCNSNQQCQLTDSTKCFLLIEDGEYQKGCINANLCYDKEKPFKALIECCDGPMCNENYDPQYIELGMYMLSSYAS